METIQKEDTKAIVEKWVNEYSEALFSWAFYKTSSKETAEDLVQDTFLAAYNKIDSFKGNSQPKTWLFSILNNKIIDHYRLSAKTTKKTISLSEDRAYEITEGFFDEAENWKSTTINPIWNQDEELLDNPEFNTVLKNCMESLPEKWNFAITSKYLTTKKVAEICQDLNITVSNYWQIVHRAKLALKNCLEVKWV
ncbi:sigma-70 family RNA polymerase sigma factor [Psychroserpens luteus]|uniref:RNA polymerase sigma factor n=1 Tax=Psychroserpens luteus TaxID=1434066 RepID=A0ABW5ZZ05_9FLAO|nr:sigma-70 family RNA polymerase sigma factor [Psychroserpens luteus]